jgi:hypothetical protein
VGTFGLAIILAPRVVFKPVAGDQVYEVAPDTVMDVDVNELHTLLESATVGLTLTVNVLL